MLHHSQFIKRLIDNKAITLKYLRKKVVYHSLCDLGRGSGVYEEPRDVLKYISRLESTAFEDGKSLCCGGSLANLKISQDQRKKIASDAASLLTSSQPDILATACPLCKKTFSSATSTRVADISELVAEALAISSLPKYSPGKALYKPELVNV